MKIKICGITNKEDALHAVSLGVDAIGFIFYKNSPRYISPEVAEEISMFLPPFVQTVGVFVNETEAAIEAIVQKCGLDVIQLHGEETPKLCMGLSCRVIKAIRVKELEDLDIIPSYHGLVSAILLDYKDDVQRGGTGKSFDWGLALRAKEYDIPLVLSGGINEGNIQKAVQLVNPYAIDLSSGVELEPGKKDYNKMESIIGLTQSL